MPDPKHREKELIENGGLVQWLRRIETKTDAQSYCLALIAALLMAMLVMMGVMLVRGGVGGGGINQTQMQSNGS